MNEREWHWTWREDGIARWGGAGSGYSVGVDATAQGCSVFVPSSHRFMMGNLRYSVNFFFNSVAVRHEFGAFSLYFACIPILSKLFTGIMNLKLLDVKLVFINKFPVGSGGWLWTLDLRGKCETTYFNSFALPDEVGALSLISDALWYDGSRS